MKKYIFYLIIVLITSSCNEGLDKVELIESEDNNSLDSSSWLIPKSEIKDGGPGKDGIPSINDPKFVSSLDANSFLNNDDLIIGVIDEGGAKAYPHQILDWHEVLNDGFITISYCPLTGTAFGWENSAGNAQTTFGVSGLLYNSNLILYDRNTGSNWSQMLLKCVNGPLMGETPKLKQVVETNWKTWKLLYPNTKVLSLDTGFSRDYFKYPYGSYKTDNDYFLFEPKPKNNALPNKERVLTIINEDVVRVYQFSKFGNGNVIKEKIDGKNYLVAGNSDIIIAFELTLEYKNLNFEYNFINSESFFKDNEGNKWSVFGKAIDGPRKGEVLQTATTVVGFWFATAAFYPNPEVY